MSGEIHDPNPDGNHTPQQISEQVAHLRVLADNYDGEDAEDWSSAADTIERLDAALRDIHEKSCDGTLGAETFKRYARLQARTATRGA